MFDTDWREASDQTVVSAIEQWAAAEAAAASRRLAAIAELVRRRCGDDDRADWACDSWDSAAAEISAAQAISHRRASNQMRLALALAQRLPRLAALFADGRVGHRVVSAIVWRTCLVEDPDAQAAIDAALAEQARTLGVLSDYKLEQAVDSLVDRFDPGGLRRTRARSRSRDIQIGDGDGDSATSALWGRMFSTDAQILIRRLSLMARQVCTDDPRTMAQRRADALGVLAAGGERLACQCGSPSCEYAQADGSPTGVVIHVLAEAPALAGTPDPNLSGEGADTPAFSRGMSLAEWAAAKPEPEPTTPASSSPILGGGMVPGPLLAELIRAGATVRHVRRPHDQPEPQYRPSTALAEFIRVRDLTCRFPNCTVPADRCDIDHAIPWPLGPTHPSCLRCECRKHHLLKTFWVGPRGWSDVQLPDGTIHWTSPSGKVYTTVPGIRLFFPDWDTDTGTLPDLRPRLPDTAGPLGRDLRMPRRRRTRVAENSYRIKRERALNNDYLVTVAAERNKPPPH